MNKKTLVIIVLVIAAAAAFAYLEFFSSGACQVCSYDGVQVSQSFMQNLKIGNSTFSAVKIGAAETQGLSTENGTNLTYGGKPEILYIGAEYCPFCAAERWAMVIALSRFGTFSNLHYMTSSASDTYASTPTFTFYNSSYSSPYISFVSVETETNVGSGGYYAPLQNMSAEQASIIEGYDKSGSIPFIDFANKTVITGATYNPQTLAGYNWTYIASQLNNPNDTISQSVVGSANLITAEVCMADGNQPQSVCGLGYIKQIQEFA